MRYIFVAYANIKAMLEISLGPKIDDDVNKSPVRRKIKLGFIIGALVILVLAALVFVSFWYESKRNYSPQSLPPLPEVSVTLLEGWTNVDFFKKFTEIGLGKIEDFSMAESKIDRLKHQFLASVPAQADLQGFLFPDTYRFFKSDTPEAVLTKLLQTFQKKFAQASSSCFLDQNFSGPSCVGSLFPKLKLSLYDLVTMASIIENETGQKGESANSARLQEERQIVAGIFYNRLIAGQALESDATINYITKAGLASPTLDQTKIDSPYNTYKYPGLPLGPIGNPSYSSIYAVLHPIKNNYYYFLHKQPSGEVVYSKTFSEHVQNKFKFLK